MHSVGDAAQALHLGFVGQKLRLSLSVLLEATARHSELRSRGELRALQVASQRLGSKLSGKAWPGRSRCPWPLLSGQGRHLWPMAIHTEALLSVLHPGQEDRVDLIQHRRCKRAKGTGFPGLSTADYGCVGAFRSKGSMTDRNNGRTARWLHLQSLSLKNPDRVSTIQRFTLARLPIFGTRDWSSVREQIFRSCSTNKLAWIDTDWEPLSARILCMLGVHFTADRCGQ